ncbi:unknown protein encoded by cryptic prophage CP-933M [Escherichia coli O157:H7 str. EDL933]|uniref:Uncharacterized protein n=1 Tax=Escherichia coli O157:H7 TaxID=83334 RepID=Q8X4C6_ECO57|nr:unknown protein encoded by cryptic prophage CP-933M [Escherichia coli O157:H7 str. EDL933]
MKSTFCEILVNILLKMIGCRNKLFDIITFLELFSISYR